LLEALAAAPDPHTSVPRERWPDVHVADSLSGLTIPELARAGRIADLGAGGGFPGLPLAIALPGARVDLIESASRKTALIDALIEAGAISNARSIHARAEEWAAGEGREAYDAVTARAVAPLAVLVEYAAPLLRLNGVLVAWRGARDAEEETAGERAAELVALSLSGVERVTPYEGSENRHLHVYRKAGPTPARIPRRPGMAVKRPLA
jgi:16S rRNA (guanine527-N7)-methyltransferase